MSITADIAIDPHLKHTLSPKNLQERLGWAAAGIIARAAAHLKASDDMPEWTGNMKDGMRQITTPDGAELLIAAEYASWVHDGIKPGTFPNVDNIADWAKAHGMEGAEWAIAHSIKKRGIPAKPFLRDYANSFEFEAMARKEVHKAVNNE